MRKNIFKRDYIKVLCLFKNNNVCFGELVEKPFHEISNLQNERKNRKNKIKSEAYFFLAMLCYA